MHIHPRILILGATALAVSTASHAYAQTFTSASGQIPQGNPFNNSFTESVNFADVDADGDLDAVFADGGDCCNDQNRIWTNNGGAQGGTLGFFTDETSTRFPAVLDDSRDIEFVDIDNDGDRDLYISNTSTTSNQSNRWWVNVGGGFFQDQTSTRWVNIAGPGSSIAPSMKLASGGFIDWSCFCAFFDADSDGDMDLFHSTYGGTFFGNVPSRVFLNDGNGFYSEFNPGGCQLTGATISNGSCGIWCEGTFQQATTNTTGQFCDIADTPLGLELGDQDGDFDVDVLQGARNEVPRIFQNRLQENGGTLSFRDVTNAKFPPGYSTGGGHYEQEMGDMDRDGDLDIYGLNWDNLCDVYLKNNGDGTFAAPVAMSNSCSDDNEGEWLDYDNDGNLDLFVANFSGQDRMYHNTGAPSYDLVYQPTGSVLPSDGSTSLAAASGDVDNDGDQDIFVANDGGQANVFLKNNTNTVDTHAPYIYKVESAPARAPSATPTVIRALIYDNESFFITAQETHELAYSVNGGGYTTVPMHWAGGNVFRGEIPGTATGDICYHVRSTDFNGNVGQSPDRCFTSSSGCTGSVSIYCTSKRNGSGCYPFMSFTGSPSSSASGNFHIKATNVLNNKNGLFFYSLVGKQAIAFQGGLLCVRLPLKRTAVQNSSGNPPPTDCSGFYDFDFDAYVLGGAEPLLQTPGTQVWGQYWSRDSAFPPPNNTGLTEAIEFTMCP